MKIKNVLIGWGKHWGFLPTSAAEVKLSELRLKQCSRCLDAVPNNILKIMNGNASYENTLTCSRCKCPCLQKTMVLSESCPINQW